MAQEEGEEIARQEKVRENNNDEEKEEEQVVKFMDSLDSYLALHHSLSSTLRQGWFDFASARYSMGAIRVNSGLLDLKEHSAATSVQVEEEIDQEPRFTLCKWTSASAEEDSADVDELQQKPNGIRQRHRDSSDPEPEDKTPAGETSPGAKDDRAQRERSKPLALFGKLVSPKLRSSQVSFESALETLVEIANVRASMLAAFDQVKEHVDKTKN